MQERAIMSDSQPIYAGIDVSKDTLDLAIGQQGKVIRFPNDSASHQALGKALPHLAAPLGLRQEATNSPAQPICKA
jgi:hypothetical protein